ncbi:hypothetical protein [Streptomyces sp. ADI98-10]|uniref:hypothetical protein n=1 Tax=Streptomyces sp. ADI98-10 TaxID=1522763 RepID=UPI000F550319|nr:hypothetical protein [Streptomyces sp. ADI98-10]RPK93034.1 hypothetical protein EES46_06990 [Streptomyces sp. ADI98-10]
MDTQQNTALLRALTELPGPLPTSGVIHVVIRHTDRFTVVGNDLAQHPGLSTTAVGFAVRIQSLPQGAEVGIKALAARFPEGERLIAAALRELEAHGYLQRARERLPNGRIVTRTVYCNQPSALLRPLNAAPHQPATRQTPQPAPPPDRNPARVPAPAPPPRLVPALTLPARPVPVPATTPQPVPVPVPAPEPLPPLATTPPRDDPAPPPRPRPTVPPVPPPTAPKPPPRPLPQPRELTPELHRAATALLADLRRHTPEFTLSEDDIQQLAPAVAAWLEREAHPDTIRHVLTDDPPRPLKQPARLLKHRLTALLPPPLPGVHDLAVPARRVTVTPFQTCDGCERAFRSPTPGRCRDCRTGHAQAAA